MAPRCGSVHAVHLLQRKALQVDRSIAFTPVREDRSSHRTHSGDSPPALLREAIAMPSRSASRYRNVIFASRNSIRARSPVA